MEDYIIVVNRIEELQSIQDRQELERIFDKARRTIIGGDGCDPGKRKQERPTGEVRHFIQ